MPGYLTALLLKLRSSSLYELLEYKDQNPPTSKHLKNKKRNAYFLKVFAVSFLFDLNLPTSSDMQQLDWNSIEQTILLRTTSKKKYLLIGFLKFFLFLQIGIHVFEHSAFWNPFIPAGKENNN